MYPSCGNLIVAFSWPICPTEISPPPLWPRVHATLGLAYSPKPLLDQRHLWRKWILLSCIPSWKLIFFARKSLTGRWEIIFDQPNFQEGYKIEVFIFATGGSTCHILAFWRKGIAELCIYKRWSDEIYMKDSWFMISLKSKSDSLSWFFNNSTLPHAAPTPWHWYLQAQCKIAVEVNVYIWFLPCECNH